MMESQKTSDGTEEPPERGKAASAEVVTLPPIPPAQDGRPAPED